MGDYIEVWGTRGIPDADFTVHWGHATAPSAAEPTPSEPVAPRLPDMPDLAVDPGAGPDGPAPGESSGNARRPLP